MSWILLEWGQWLLQVLYVLGVGMMCMVALRGLGTRTLVGLGLLLIAGNEWLSAVLTRGGLPAVPSGLVVQRGLLRAEPFHHRLSPGALAGRDVSGVRLRAPAAHFSSRAGVARLLGASGVASLGLFLLMRGLNGYGNEKLYREGNGLLQWLHVSKYPPSLAYAALELGLMALLLAAFWWVQERWGEVKVLAPLKLLGQTALFFYLLYVHLLYGAAILLGVKKQLGLGATYGAAVVILGVLSVACGGYRRYNAAHPQGWTRYV